MENYYLIYLRKIYLKLDKILIIFEKKIKNIFELKLIKKNILND